MAKPSGYIQIFDPKLGVTTKELETLQCCHCGGHFQMAMTSAFCRNCMKPTCGNIQCDPCVNFEKKLDLYEKGKLKDLR